MHKNLIEQASESLRKSISEKAEAALFEDKRYKTVQFDEKNFHSIADAKDSVQIAFVDGGNIEILRSAGFSLQFVRLFWSCYEGKQRVNAERVEFYLACHTMIEDDKLYYETEIIAEQEWLQELRIKVDAYNPSLKQGMHRADISSMANVVRRFGELLMGVRAAAHSDIVVLDGDLEATYPGEERLLERLYATGKLIAGLSKTSTLLSTSGQSFSASLARQGKWYYYPVAEVNGAEVLFAKLHEKSQYIFKIEIYKNQKGRILELVSGLAGHATDPIFLGYPYGLIEAHRFAKVPAAEKDFHKIQLMAKLGEKWKDVEQHLRSVDGHELLDRI